MREAGLRGKRVVVFGGQASGSAAARLLARQGARVTLTDLAASVRDQDALADEGVRFELGGNRPETAVGADLVVVSPGVPLDQPALVAALRAGVPVIGEIELAWRLLEGRVIAITGTKGKSTTTTLVGRMLEAAGFPVRVSGNIGNPLSAEVEGSSPETIHVAEVSSFQLESTTSFRPWIAVVLNISPDHLDRHPDLDAYMDAKARVGVNQLPEDWTVVNAEDPRALAVASRSAARKHLFAVDGREAAAVTIEGGDIVRREGGRTRQLLPLAAIHLQGAHLLSDVVAAAAVADLAGVSPPEIAKAVSSFRGLEHAMELVAEVSGVRFVNDSKATNVEAARHSVESSRAPVVPILGGVFKGGDLGVLRDALAGRARLAVLIGASRERFRSALEGVVPVCEVRSMSEAVSVAFDAARPDGTVLLAPACASFDMFENYAARGRAFKAEVERLRAREGVR
ncbi:MAG: UDP-N-acetylmuramoyl-L-alanine--D-glutamate ligase [Vicinamibacterales bacterium]